MEGRFRSFSERREKVDVKSVVVDEKCLTKGP